jgi:hypothetical protein
MRFLHLSNHLTPTDFDADHLVARRLPGDAPSESSRSMSSEADPSGASTPTPAAAPALPSTLRPAPNTMMTIAVALSVAVMVGGEVGAALTLLSWALANLLALPFTVLAIALIISLMLSAYVALLFFVRVYRVERRLARGEGYDDLDWRIF